MARNKIDPAISRKAYSTATKALKALNADQFSLLLDEAYAALGVESPNARRERLERERILKSAAAAEQRALRQQKKIEEAKALLEAAGLQVIPGTESAA